MIKETGQVYQEKSKAEKARQRDYLESTQVASELLKRFIDQYIEKERQKSEADFLDESDYTVRVS